MQRYNFFINNDKVIVNEIFSPLSAFAGMTRWGNCNNGNVVFHGISKKIN